MTQEEANELLFNAQTAEDVKRALAAGANVTAQDANGNTPGHQAIYSDCWVVLEALINAGDRLDTKNHCGLTVLDIAGMKEGKSLLYLIQLIGQQKLKDQTLFNATTASDIRSALSIGANVNAKGPFGRTPLLRAMLKGYWKVAETLLNEDVNVNAQDQAGDTASHFLAMGYLTKLAPMIFAKNPDLTIKNNDGLTAIELAISHRQFELAKQMDQMLKKAIAESIKAEARDAELMPAKAVKPVAANTTVLITDKSGKAALTSPSGTGSDEATRLLKRDGYPQNRVFYLYFNQHTYE